MKCEIVRDLLPLYIDKVCSNETETEVKTHLETCNECRAVYDDMAREMKNQTEPKAVPNEKVIYMGIRQKIGNMLLYAILFVAVVGLAFSTFAEIGEHGWPQGMFAIGFFVPCAAFLLSMVNILLLGEYSSRRRFCWASGSLSAFLCLVGDVAFLLYYKFPPHWQDCIPLCIAIALVFGGMSFCVSKLYSRFCNR